VRRGVYKNCYCYHLRNNRWICEQHWYLGLWGLLFLLPFWSEDLIKKEAILSVGPLLLMLFIVFPKMGAGVMGLKLGNTAPVFALFFTLVWGISAALFLKIIKK